MKDLEKWEKENARWKTISATQLKASGFDSLSKEPACKRKYVFDRVFRLDKKKKEHPSALLGKTGHRVFEFWFRDGIPPDPRSPAAYLIMSGLRHWEPNTFLELEKKCTIALDNIHPGLEFVAYMDIYGEGYAGDHKFTSNINGSWTLRSAADMHKDLQARLMALLVSELQKREYVETKWVYYHTRGVVDRYGAVLPFNQWEGKSRLQTAVFGPDDHKETWSRFQDDTNRLKIFRDSKPHWADIEPELKRCNDFGGCPYQEICLVPREGRTDMSSDELLALLEQSTTTEPEVVDVTPDYSAPAKDAPVAETPPPAEEVEAPKPKKRGRPKGSTNKKKKEPAPAAEPAQPVDVEMPDPAPVAQEIINTVLDELAGTMSRIADDIRKLKI